MVERLNESEIFNVVVGKEFADEGLPQRRSSDDSIDLVFNGEVLTVVACYSKYVYNWNQVTGLLEDCPSNLLANVINHGNASNADESDTIPSGHC